MIEYIMEKVGYDTLILTGELGYNSFIKEYRGRRKSNNFFEKVSKDPMPFLMEACNVNKMIKEGWIYLGEGGYYDPESKNLMLIRRGRIEVYPEDDRRKRLERVPVLID